MALRPPVSGGGSAELPAWLLNHPDAPPAAPNAWDDEFEADALDPAWSWLNQDGANATPGSRALTLTIPGKVDDGLHCVLKPWSGAGAVRTRVSLSSHHQVANHNGGLVLYNQANGRLLNHAIHTSADGFTALAIQRWNSPISVNASEIIRQAGPVRTLDLHITLEAGGAIRYWWALPETGRWLHHWNGALADFLGAVTHVGLYGRTATGAAEAYNVFHWIRRL